MSNEQNIKCSEQKTKDNTCLKNKKDHHQQTTYASAFPFFNFIFLLFTSITVIHLSFQIHIMFS